LDWLFLNPVLEGYISYADLKNGAINLYDLYVMNELIAYKQRRVQEEANKVKVKKAMKNG